MLGKKYFWISLFLHLLTMTVIFMRFHTQLPINYISNPFMKSYTYSSTSSPQVNHQLKSVVKSFSHQQSVKISHELSIDNNSKEILLRILHQAIAKNQVYPESALALQQSGTVTIGFLLSQRGQLSNISLIKSSGVDSIDSAALSSVKSITTISEASHYLQDPEFFQIDVVFQ